jgi:fibronectin type 3 domain-containing protein
VIPGVTSEGMILYWVGSPSPDVAGYNVYRSEDPGGPFVLIGSNGLATSYFDSGLTVDISYYYVVSAFDEVPNESPFSNEASNTTIDTISPSVPTGISVEILPHGNSLKITWKEVTDSDLEQYLLYRSLDNDTFIFIVSIESGTEFYVDQELENNITYYYLLRSRDEVPNLSDISEIASGVPKDSTTPSKPGNLKASLGLVPNSVKLTWDANSEEDLNGYTVYYSSISGGPYLWYATLGLENTFYVFNLDDDTTYYFVIDAYDEVPNNSSLSDEASYTTPDRTSPLPPANLVAQAQEGGGSVLLTWDPNTDSDLDHYALYMGCDESTFIWIADIPAGLHEFVHTDLEDDQEYFFIVAAFDEVPNKSPMSNIASATPTSDPPPLAPTGLSVIVIEDVAGLNISWNPNSETDLSHYVLYRRSDNLSFEPIANISVGRTDYIDEDVVAGQTYTYRLSAVDINHGESELSESASGVPQSMEVEPPEEEEEDNFIMFIIILIIIVIVLILFLIIRRKMKGEKEPEIEEESEELDEDKNDMGEEGDIDLEDKDETDLEEEDEGERIDDAHGKVDNIEEEGEIGEDKKEDAKVDETQKEGGKVEEGIDEGGERWRRPKTRKRKFLM